MHILAGATAVQVGTCLHEEGVSAFDRIEAELAAIMQAKATSGWRSSAGG